MNVQWFSEGRKYWGVPSSDWLCIRVKSTDPPARLRLEEGTHHFFDEIHLFDGRRPEPRTSRALHSCGPFDISIDPKVMEGLIAVKVHFLPYSASPLDHGEDFAETYCGSLQPQGKPPRQILMQITPGGSAGARLNATPLPDLQTVRMTMLQATDLQAPLLTAGNHASTPFQLSAVQDADIRVYLVSDRFLLDAVADASLRLGSVVAFDGIDSAVPHVRIPRGKFAPTSAVRGDWTLALPVRMLDQEKGLVGAPLPAGPSALVGSFAVKADFRTVFTEFHWNAPPGWMELQLSWNFYDASGWEHDEEWARTNLSMTASGAQYDSARRRLPLPIVRRETVGRSIFVRAIPQLFGESCAEAAVEAYTEL